MRIALVTFIYLIVICSTWADNREGSKCNIEESRLIAFSAKKESDVFSVAVIGDSCFSATFSVEIKNNDGVPIYTYKKPLSSFYPSGDPINHQQPKELLEQAERLVSSNLPESSLPKSTELPPYQIGHFEIDSFSDGKVIIEEALYMQLRNASLPYIYHSISYEAGQYIIYDKATKSAVAVLQSWL